MLPPMLAAGRFAAVAERGAPSSEPEQPSTSQHDSAPIQDLISATDPIPISKKARPQGPRGTPPVKRIFLGRALLASRRAANGREKQQSACRVRVRYRSGCTALRAATALDSGASWGRQASITSRPAGEERETRATRCGRTLASWPQPARRHAWSPPVEPATGLTCRIAAERAPVRVSKRRRTYAQ